MNEPLALYPGEIKAIKQSVSAGPIRIKGGLPVRQHPIVISASFDKNAVLAAVPNGDIEIEVSGKLMPMSFSEVPGEYFSGSDTVKIIHQTLREKNKLCK